MRLRRFSGRSSREALAAVKAALGPEAVILATRPHPEGGVEITAAVDLEPAAVEPRPAAAPGSEVAALARELAAVAARVARIDRALTPGRGAAGGLDEEGQALAERLALNGTPPALAEALGLSFARARREGVAPAAALAASVARHLVVAPVIGEPPVAGDSPVAGEPCVTAFVGPTGSGKTTTIAKLAARAVAGGASVGLVMADTRRIGAAEQLGTYARLLGVPMRTARDGAELAAALDAFDGRDVVYVDTAGLAGDVDAVAETAAILACGGRAAAAGVVTTTAVVAAGASESALRAAWRGLAGFAPARCVVTKVDEGGGLGAACGWLADLGVPLAWLGTGTRVPDDLVTADGAAVAAWLTAA